MSFDFLIILFGATEFIVFLLLHIVVFRWIKHDAILKWLMYLYIFTSLFGAVFVFWFFSSILTLPSSNFWQLLFLTLITTVIFFTLLVGAYIIGIFGIIESSIRIRALSLIVYTKNKGLTTTTLFRRYNKKIIIEKRLARFKSSGSVIVRKGKYFAGKQSLLLTFIGSILNLYSRLIYAKDLEAK